MSGQRWPAALDAPLRDAVCNEGLTLVALSRRLGYGATAIAERIRKLGIDRDAVTLPETDLPHADLIRQLYAEPVAPHDIAGFMRARHGIIVSHDHVEAVLKAGGSYRAAVRLANVFKIIKPVPADFAERAAVMTLSDLCGHYDVTKVVALRWEREAGVKFTRRPPGHPMHAPSRDELADMATRMTIDDIAIARNVKPSTVSEWLRKAGLKAKPALTARNVEWGSFIKKRKVMREYDVPRVDPDEAVRADRAAKFLARFGPVSRCNKWGLADRAGPLWRRGNTVMTDADIIERAERLGWLAPWEPTQLSITQDYQEMRA